MATNMSRNELSAWICTNRYDADRPDQSCEWNVRYSDIVKITSEGYNTSAWIPRAWITCPTNVTCYPDFNSAETISMYFLQNGKIFMNKFITNGHLDCILGSDEYCFVYSVAENETKSLLTACKSLFEWLINTTHHNSALNDETDIDIPYAFTLFNIITMCISLLFFIVTFVIYTILPELNNFHGLLLRIFTFCSFVVVLLNTAMFIKPIIACNTVIAIIDHFMFMIKFLWLNAMSFDVWWTFRSLKKCRKTFPKKKMIIYSIYVLGTSMLIVGVGAIIEFVPNLPKGLLSPSYDCMGTDGSVDYYWAYYDGPISVTLAINTCFFVSTAITIYKQKNDTAKQLGGNDSGQHNNDKNRFYIYLKLFLTMGVLWGVGIIANNRDSEQSVTAVTYIFESPKLLEGVIIFFVFVMNDRTKRLLSARFGLKKQRPTQAIELTTPKISTPVRQN